MKGANILIRLNGYDTQVVLEEIDQNLGAEIPPEDYRSIIRPYENKRHLVALYKVKES